ncbi:MAG: TonB-dependent receptor [Campylobacterota bacterium]|nr:TonB-dependent receptor [Campylobacterota bacterium]
MKLIFFASLLLPLLLLHANEISLEEDFLASLDEVSDIASKSKLNIDDMPSFVTILHGNKLELLGVQNIYEALGLVPGVELSMEASGAKQVIFRGVKEKGEVKLLIDGVSLNNAYRGSIYYYLDFPIEMVERIEVIRGPGSVLYGSNAISGVISIITKNSKTVSPNRIFATASTAPSYKTGLQYNYNLSENSRLSMDGYIQNDDIHIDGGPDKAERYGESDETLRDYALGMHLDIDNFTLLARFKQSQMGMHFGIGNYFESKNDKEGHTNTSAVVEANYEDEINSHLGYKLSLGTNYYAQKIETRFLPHPTQGDLIYDSDYGENSYYGELTIHNTIQNHALIIGARYEYSATQKTSLENYFEPTGETYLPSTDVIKPDSDRSIASLYINDSMTINSDIDLIAGIRLDHYSDFGDALSPRLGIVWRADSQWNLKMLYSRSFRAPSWVELYADITGVSAGNPDLDAEVADTIELGTVYRPSSSHRLRFNIYATQIDNLITREATHYQQTGKNSYYGGEAEWMATLGSETDLKLAISYVDAIDDNTTTLPEIANILSNITLLHSFDFGLSSGSVLKYVSKRSRAYNDEREDLEAYLLFDQSFTYYYEKIKLSLTLKNVLDTDYAYSAPEGTYINDYPRLGRSAYFSAGWEF